MEYHLIYTLPDEAVVSEEKDFESFACAEEWLTEIGAIYWEIGVADILDENTNRADSR